MLNQKENSELLAKVGEQLEQVEGRSLWQDARRRFFQNKAAVASLIILFFIMLFVSFTPMLMPFSYEDTDWE